MMYEEPRRVAPMSFERTQQWLRDLARNIRPETLQPLQRHLETKVSDSRKILGHSHRVSGVMVDRAYRATLHKELAVRVPALRAVRALRQQLAQGQPTDLAARRLGVWMLRMATGRHPREIEQGPPSNSCGDRALRHKMFMFSQPTPLQHKVAMDLVEQFPSVFPALDVAPTRQVLFDQARKLREDRSALVGKILQAGVLSPVEAQVLRQMEAAADGRGLPSAVEPQKDLATPVDVVVESSDLAPLAASSAQYVLANTA